MATTALNAKSYEHLIRLVRVARGLEAGGYYNAAKLFWAAAFSEELHASNEQGVPLEVDDLDHEMQTAIDTLGAAGAKLELIAALQYGRQAAREDRTIPWTEIPPIYVCRTCGEIALGQAPQRCPEPVEGRCHTCGARALTFREFPPVHYLEPLSPQQVMAALAGGYGERYTVGTRGRGNAPRCRPNRRAFTPACSGWPRFTPRYSNQEPICSILGLSMRYLLKQ